MESLKDGVLLCEWVDGRREGCLWNRNVRTVKVQCVGFKRLRMSLFISVQREQVLFHLVSHVGTVAWKGQTKHWLDSRPFLCFFSSHSAASLMDATKSYTLVLYLFQQYCILNIPPLNSWTFCVFFFRRLINVLQPGSVRKINNSTQNWHQVMQQLCGQKISLICPASLKVRVFFQMWNCVSLPYWHWQHRQNLFTFH